MCGLAGFRTCPSTPENELRRLAEAMTATLLHRGPDDAGIWVDPACGLALGPCIRTTRKGPSFTTARFTTSRKSAAIGPPAATPTPRSCSPPS
jgi:hypothetical protein